MEKFISFLCFYICVILFLKESSGCYLEFSSQPPLIVRSFGSRTVIQRPTSAISLVAGEKITAYCSSNIIITKNGNYVIGDEDNVQNITAKCDAEGNIIVNNYSDINENTYRFKSYERPRVYCNRNIIEVFESKIKLKNCDNYMSYGIGYRSIGNANLSTVGLCYDIDALKIKYAKYIVYPPKLDLVSKKLDFKEEVVVNLDASLANINTLFSFPDFRNELLNQLYWEKNPLFKELSFSFESLLQNDQFSEQIKDFKNMFNIIWWNNLKNGNWKFLLDAIKDRADNVTYMAYTGTSGVLTTPSMIDCKKTDEFEVLIEEKNIKAPSYVWTYLKSLTKNIEESIVFVGYNSPFYKIGKTEDFCEDQCENIEWLKTSLFGKSHLMPIHGVVYCCRPEDVRKHLDNFPYEEEEQLTTTNTPNIS